MAKIYGIADLENSNTVPSKTYLAGYSLLGDDKHYIFSGNSKTNIDRFFESLFSHKKSIIIYFHNLSYDGRFLIDHMLRNEYEYIKLNEHGKIPKEYDNCFGGIIDTNGTIYKMVVKHNGTTITIKDTFRIISASLDKIGKDFECKTKKLKGTVDYNDPKYFEDDYNAFDDEVTMRYFIHDLDLTKEILEKIIEEGMHEKLTIAANALDRYKDIFYDKPKEIGTKFYKKNRDNYFRMYYPLLSKEEDNNVRKSYRGGWCYNNTDSLPYANCRGKIEGNYHQIEIGYTYDVNSLYPYVLQNEDFLYPIGYGEYITASEIDLDKCLTDDKHVYVFHLVTSFKIKDNHLPFLQIKNNFRYAPNEFVKEGFQEDIWLTSVDMRLFLKQYDIKFLHLFGAYKYTAKTGRQLFGKYIDTMYEGKAKSKGAKRSFYKLLMNSLYGKFGASLTNYAGEPFISDKDNAVHLHTVEEEIEGVYIPIASFTTSYGRWVTVNAAQMQEDNEKGSFLYADTDSIHLSRPAVGINIDPKKIGYWDNEAVWTKARFIRQKTYIEYCVEGDKKKWNVKACGLPDEGKNYIVAKYGKDLINVFKKGLTVEGKKLRRCQVEGGTILTLTDFSIR